MTKSTSQKKIMVRNNFLLKHIRYFHLGRTTYVFIKVYEYMLIHKHKFNGIANTSEEKPIIEGLQHQ